MLNNDNNYIEKALLREAKITYEISHYDRNDAKGAWTFARTSGAPFNYHLSFSFEFDVNQSASNIKCVRHIAHKLRMWYQTKRLPSNILWTRFVAKGSNIERVDILVHVPDANLANFRKVVTGWDLEIAINTVSYYDDQFFAGKTCTIFDLMFRAVSNETRAKQTDAPDETSEPIVGPRFFYSVKLWIPARRHHRIANATKSIDVEYSNLT